MARPKFEGEIRRYHITLCLREGEHDDLIPIMEDVEPRQRAQAVITAMRQGIKAVAADCEIDEEATAEAFADMLF